MNPQKLHSVDAKNALAQVTKIFELELGDRLNLDAVRAAEAVIRVANTKMAGAIRMVSISLGADPRDFALFAFGGVNA